jgi:hypothetical protein
VVCSDLRPPLDTKTVYGGGYSSPCLINPSRRPEQERIPHTEGPAYENSCVLQELATVSGVLMHWPIADESLN